MRIEEVPEPTIQDLHYTAEQVITDTELWNEQDGANSDDVYRILLDDDTAVDLFYDSHTVVQVEFGRVYRYGGPNGAQLSMNTAHIWDRGQFIVIEHVTTQARLEIDCQHIVAIGPIPYDMSLFSGTPRTIY